MRPMTIRLLTLSVLPCLALVVAAQQLPVPPVKSGLWETRMSALDAAGHEIAPPEQSALSNMPPEVRARMAEAMKARGLSMPDASGANKVCFTKETFESGRWQEMSSEAGCATKYSTLSGATWKWHSSCTALKSESDGEVTFNSPESYRVKVTTTAPVMGKPNTSTRVIQAKWLGADCGDIKPFTHPGARK
jgi:Protein of unknown function (DUF3617)